MVTVSLDVLIDAAATLNVVADVSIAISPELASSIASLSAVDDTDVISVSYTHLTLPTILLV